jgi:hypothetical protein
VAKYALFGKNSGIAAIRRANDRQRIQCRVHLVEAALYRPDYALGVVEVDQSHFLELHEMVLDRLRLILLTDELSDLPQAHFPEILLVGKVE